MSTKIIIQLVIILFLTLLNAFFAAAEMAIISTNKIKLKTKSESGDKNAALLLKLTKEPSKFLATIQVGITLAGFFSSASAATGLSSEFAGVLTGLNIPYANQISVIFITIILSYFMLVFGELLPKRVALQRAEKIALFAAKPIYYISKIAAPFVKLLSLSTNLLMRIIGVDDNDLEQQVSEEQIKSLVKVGQEHGVINQTEKQMINNIFEFDDTLAKEVMTSRVNVFMVEVNTDIDKLVNVLNTEKHSRVPIYEGNKDNIVGVLLLKSILFNMKKDYKPSIKECMDDPFFVPETKPIDELFIELQGVKKHMAILLDEYGVFSGIVTMEDLVEEIMGDILDEFDNEIKHIDHIDNSTYLIDGFLSIDEFNKAFQAKIEDNNATTISGFIINQLGYLPNKENQKDIIVTYEGFVFKAEVVDNYMIRKIKLTTP